MPEALTAPAEDATPVERRDSFRIHRINAHLARLCNPMFRRWRVDIDLARMLAVLDQQGAMAAGEMVRIMALPQSTVSHRLKRLESLGYVRRASGVRDSRVISVSLTQAGQAVASQSNALSRQIAAVLEEALAGLDHAVFATALERIDARLAGLQGLGEAP